MRSTAFGLLPVRARMPRAQDAQKWPAYAHCCPGKDAQVLQIKLQDTLKRTCTVSAD